MLYQLSYSRKLSGESRIRTCEGKNQQIYSLSSLAAWVSPQIKYFKELSRWRDSNPRPADYKSAALASWATSAYTFFQKKARIKRTANVNIYFFKQNKLYFFLIRKQTCVNPYFWGVFFWKLFWFLRLIYWCKLVLQQDWYDQANLLQNLNRHHYLKDE